MHGISLSEYLKKVSNDTINIMLSQYDNTRV